MTPPADSAPPDKAQPPRVYPRRTVEPMSGPPSVDKTQPSPRTRRERARAEWPWWSVVSLLLLALVALAGAGGSLAYALRTPSPAVWPTVVLVTVTRELGPTPVAATETPRASVPWSNVTRYVRVNGTQGFSLRIRAAPSTQAETVKLVPDGTRLIVTGDGKQAEDELWWPVRDPSDNKEGWAVSTYLVPDATP
jgi:hypothetical protein